MADEIGITARTFRDMQTIVDDVITELDVAMAAGVELQRVAAKQYRRDEIDAHYVYPTCPGQPKAHALLWAIERGEDLTGMHVLVHALVQPSHGPAGLESAFTQIILGLTVAANLLATDPAKLAEASGLTRMEAEIHISRQAARQHADALAAAAWLAGE